MISLQVINKVLQSADYSIIEDNELTVQYFAGYEDEYGFIESHYKQYGNVPDKETFLNKFKEWEILQVQESDAYLVDTLREEYLYYVAVPVIQKSAELLKSNSFDAVQYLISETSNFNVSSTTTSVNIIKRAEDRLKEYEDKKNNPDDWFVNTGFEELDEIVKGWGYGEEFVVLFARTGQGKSWVLAKTAKHAWLLGLAVGYISPEMSPTRIGYRFDTLYKNFSNKNLLRGEDEPEYPGYIKELSTSEVPFYVATPKDFQKKITISKLRQFVKSNKLKLLAVDGITYLTDERYKRGDNRTTTLTNISEDLMALSNELKIPILVVVQSNRGGVKQDGDEGTPDIENIRDSDGIAQNATKVISLRQTGAGLELGIKKNRDGTTGGKLVYFWDIDKGQFNYIPSSDDASKPATRQEKVEKVKKTYKDKADIF